MTSAAKTLAVLMCGASAAMALCACRPGAQEAAAADAPPPLAALPLTDAAAPPAAPGPLAVDLPAARPARLGPLLDPDDGYAYLDRAYFLNEAFDDAPPDYGFAYADDEQPWVWRTDDGFYRIVELLPYGVRYAYYEPGADGPFLIRDPDYGYAYADGQLVAVYDSSGALLPPEDLTLHAGVAGRELARAQALFRGARRDLQPVALAAWAARRGQVSSDVARWRALEARQDGWRSYHQAHLKPEQAHWAPERFRRAAETARIDRQLHDPDGAEHALRNVRQAQDVARRAHVRIATLAHDRQGARAYAVRTPAAPVPNGRAGPGRDIGPVRPGGDRLDLGGHSGPQRLAMTMGGAGERPAHALSGPGQGRGRGPAEAARGRAERLQIVRTGGHGPGDGAGHGFAHGAPAFRQGGEMAWGGRREAAHEQLRGGAGRGAPAFGVPPPSRGDGDRGPGFHVASAGDSGHDAGPGPGGGRGGGHEGGGHAGGGDGGGHGGGGGHEGGGRPR